MKIKKIRFTTPAFRMFQNMEIEIADRLTVIAGHNGIGKSTLLGLIANGSEVKSTFGKTLLKRPFQAQLHELFYLDEAKDYVSSRGDKPMFELEYHDDELDNLVKVCKVSKHSEKDGSYRLKVVPRGSAEGWNVGNEAKVNIPTLFLSMSRMIPLGETSDLLKEDIMGKLSEDDINYIRTQFTTIVDAHVAGTNNIIRHELRSTTKRSLLPEFSHSAKAISLGQDSLSTIITALASFNKLKRENSDYKGGILLIDEVDAGFHPRVQVKLINLLKKEAKRLHLQIIMTSHSLVILEEVLKITDDQARNSYHVDSVVYLKDIYKPSLMENPSFEKIKMDMMGELPLKEDQTPILKLYFEDSEALWFFQEIINTENFNIEEYCGYKPSYIAAKLGWDNLRGLYEADDYFKTVILILDNDVMGKQLGKQLIENHDTILALPAYIENTEENDERRTLEYQIYSFLKSSLSNVDHPLWISMTQGYTIENIKDRIIDEFPLASTNKSVRELRKDWFNKNQHHFEALSLVKHFCHDHHDIIMPFIIGIKSAIDHLLNNSKDNGSIST